MTTRLRALLHALAEAFWLLPAALVLAGIALALSLVHLDRIGAVPEALIQSPWIYSGSATGARTLLGAVASSTIGVAGTVFSITIAALSLAAGQMGPRLLRNFTRDRGNQVTLGTFLGTFVYALMVLRTVRAQDEGEFVPHLALSVGIALSVLCVGLLVFFVGHMAGRINVDTVIELVAAEVRDAVRRLTEPGPPRAPDPPLPPWPDALPVRDPRRGYLRELDAGALADWAAERGTALRLLVRAGDHVFPGAVLAHALAPAPDADALAAALARHTALGPERTGSTDLGFAVRQLVEVAVRALSPGINDPHTAMAVLDRLGAALCDLASRHLPSGTHRRDGRVVLVVPVLDYDALADGMLDLIRQNAAGSAAVLGRMLAVLAAAAGVERHPPRLATLSRHAALVLADAERDVSNPSDLEGLRRLHAGFLQARDCK